MQELVTGNFTMSEKVRSGLQQTPPQGISIPSVVDAWIGSHRRFHQTLARRHALSCLLGFLLLACITLFLPKTLLADSRYVVGIVPQFDARHIRKVWRPILDSIEQRTGVTLLLAGSRNISTFEKQFEKGEFDFAFMNPYHLVSERNAQGYLPLVRDVGRSLHGIVVVAKGSPIQDVKQLDGKVVAFPAPNALGASLLVRADFLNKLNIRVQERYVQTHSSVYLNVALGQVDAGGGVQKSLDQQPAEVREALRVIYRTREVPAHPFTVHPRVPEAVRASVREALLELGETEQGRALLAQIPIDSVGRADTEDYRSLAEMGLEQFAVDR